MLNNSVMLRNLIKENELLDDLKSDDFIVSQMQSVNVYKDSLFADEVKLLKLIKRSNSFSVSYLD